MSHQPSSDYSNEDEYIYSIFCERCRSIETRLCHNCIRRMSYYINVINNSNYYNMLYDIKEEDIEE